MKAALDGVKVADFSWFGAGPICASHMATYGATVVRVESESHIDALRTVAPFAKDKTGYNVSGYFNNFNAGKLGLTLNLNTEKGQELAQRLVDWSDVFLTNFTPRVVERWGLTYDKLAAINPRIIAAYVPMQGYEGPHRDFLGFGQVLTPVTGYNHLSGFPNRPPMGLGTNYPDYVINPGHTLIAILAALRYRRRTGKGQHIECTQIESSVCPLAPAIFDYTVNGRVQGRALVALHRHVGGDDPGVDGGQLVVRQAPSLDHARREVGQKDIRPGDEPLRDLLALIRVEIEGQVQLARVEVVEVAADVVPGLVLGERLYRTQGIYAGLRLHSHDRGAKGGQVFGADRPGPEPREVRDV